MTGEETPTTELEGASWWEDIVDVYFSPAELFERRREARWLPPALILLALSVLLYFLLLPAARAVMEAAMTEEPEAAQAMERWRGLFVFLGALFLPIGIAIAIALRAAVIWAVARIAELALAFGRAVLIAVYASYVMLVEQVVEGILILLHRDGELDPVRDASTGVLRFVPEGLPEWAEPLLGRLDVFPIWQAVLWAIGVRVVARASWVQAVIVAAAVWLLSAVPGLIGALTGMGG